MLDLFPQKGSTSAAANGIPMKNSTNSKSISTKRLPKKELLYSKESKVEAGERSESTK